MIKPFLQLFQEPSEDIAHLQERLVATEVPLDEDGFVVAFDLPEQASEYLAFFETHGFAVAKGVLIEKECDDTIAEFWNRQVPGARDDPSSWNEIWARHRFGHLGIIGLGPELSPCQVKNRQNPKVYEAFATVLQTRKLISDHDRLGIMRPTIDIEIGGEKHEMKQWRTRENWLHLDCNPVTGFASIGGFDDDGTRINFSTTLIIQSLLTLTDARVEDGGFHCVPGGHKYSASWAEHHQNEHSSTSNMQVMPDHCELCAKLHSSIQKIAIRKGCHLAWSSLLFHGNYPNHSQNFRSCQYLRAMPATGTPYKPLIPELSSYPENVEISELGKKLFGIEPWE